MTFKHIPGEFTGIYQEGRWSADDPANMLKALKAITDSMDIDVQFGDLEQRALKTFSENCTNANWYRSLPDGAEPIAKDAQEVLWQLKIVRDFIKQGDLKNAVLHAWKLGRADARMEVRPFEPHALIGHRVLEGARKGHAAVHGTKEERKRKWAKFQQEVDRISVENPMLSHRAIARQVARAFLVTEATILRRTYHLRRIRRNQETDKQKK